VSASEYRGVRKGMRERREEEEEWERRRRKGGREGEGKEER
jgi:hypothetical protein